MCNTSHGMVDSQFWQSFFIAAYFKVFHSGIPNFRGCRIPIPSKLDFKFLERHLADYHDYQVVNLLKYSFPLGHNRKMGVSMVEKNHTGARLFVKEMRNILKNEVSSGAAISPFNVSPFGNDTCLSPLNSVPKKDSHDRRLILDLSYPPRNSVNDGIDKDYYLGECDKLVLPSVDNLVNWIMKLGKGCRIFKVDFQKAYHQIYLCPGSISKVFGT